MAVKPILFSPPMVQAILGGHKTVTRRLTNLRDQSVVKADPKTLARFGHPFVAARPPCYDGDILWVREKWSRCLDLSTGTPAWKYAYFADGKDRLLLGRDENGQELTTPVNWMPSIHMPKEAARLFLRVVNIRVERLWEITDEDARREGCKGYVIDYAPDLGRGSAWTKGLIFARQEFYELWDSLLKPGELAQYGWDANPWVWRIEFQRCEKPDGWPC